MTGNSPSGSSIPATASRRPTASRWRGILTKGELKALENGIDLPDGRFAPADVRLEKTNRGSTWLSITITDGRNRVIRRAFDSIGHSVARLVRIAVADLSLGSLREGSWRMLEQREVERLLALARSGKTGKKFS